MAEIVQRENPVLRRVAKEVPAEEIKSRGIQRVLKDMATALETQDDGVALAAPQIGHSLRIFIVSKAALKLPTELSKRKEMNIAELKKAAGYLVFINPVITKRSRDKVLLDEGCLSVRPLYGKIKRSKKATIQAYDEQGKKFTRGASGLLAQIFQHECDHLDGILFIDKATDLRELTTTPANPFVFFGTDDFSTTVLEQLKRAGFLPAIIITAPDRPKGRGLILASPPVKEWAKENKIGFLQPEKLDSSFDRELRALSFELFIVASYRLIIPKPILDLPKHGALNVHPSLLPKYRGATPIESQILNDEKEIGVTIMRMDEEVDHGPILAKREWEIAHPPSLILDKSELPKASELKNILAEEGGRLLAEVLPKWIAGEIKPVPQDESKATYTKKFTKADGEINLSDDLYPDEAERRRRAYKNFLKIRAFEDSIGSYFFVEVGADRRGLHPNTSSPQADGTGHGADTRRKKKVRVLIKDATYENGKLLITRVIPEGKKEMSYEEFMRGWR